MKKTHLAILAAAAVFATAGMNGCYTMLEHPGVQATDDTTGEVITAEVTHAERCTDCHTGNVHGGRAAMREGHSGAYEGWSDYDPFWDNGNYYDPFRSSRQSSPYFFDNYYSYRNLPWWVYPPISEGGGSSDPGQVSAPAAKEKPARRGGMGTEDNRSSTPISSTRSSGGSGADKPSTAPSTPSDSGNDSDKEKPARRGGIK